MDPNLFLLFAVTFVAVLCVLVPRKRGSTPVLRGGTQSTRSAHSVAVSPHLCEVTTHGDSLNSPTGFMTINDGPRIILHDTERVGDKHTARWHVAARPGDTICFVLDYDEGSLASGCHTVIHSTNIPKSLVF